MFGFGKKKADQPDSTQVLDSKSAENTSLLGRLKSGLQKTRSNLGEGLSTLLSGKKAIDAALLEELENHLLMADVGIKTTMTIIDEITASLEREQLTDSGALYTALQ